MIKKNKRSFTFGATFFSGIFFGFILTANLNITMPSWASWIASKSETSEHQHDGNDFNLLETSHVFTRVAKNIIPTVVSIHSTMMVRTTDLWNNQFNDKELQEFFGEKYMNFPVPQEFRQRGSGSGIVISRDGYIITNVHVIEKAEAITVTLSDNRTFKAKLIGADPLTELAVIKVNATSLPYAKLGNSDSLSIGEWVLAVGNPLELSSTVTAGIISAIGRDINIIADNYGVENFIQTDATINPGNSGGALVNLKGEVIGINTAIATQSGYNQGYGFAIPINLAKEIMKDLIRQGYVIRTYLGVSMQDVDEKIARALGLKRPSGVFIDNVIKDGPAWKAGLHEKDILIKIGNQIVNKGNIVQSIIAQKKPADEILLTVIRKSKLLKIKLILGERQGTIMKLAMRETKRTFSNLGLEVDNIGRRMAEELSLNSGEGVIVVDIQRFSASYDAGVQINDVVLKIDGKSISSVYSFNSALSSLKKGNVYIFKMKRGDNVFHVFIEVA